MQKKNDCHCVVDKQKNARGISDVNRNKGLRSNESYESLGNLARNIIYEPNGYC